MSSWHLESTGLTIFLEAACRISAAPVMLSHGIMSRHVLHLRCHQLLLCRKPGGEAMADSITALVNETVPSGNSLTRAEVLDYIDVGRSPGGSEVSR